MEDGKPEDETEKEKPFVRYDEMYSTGHVAKTYGVSLPTVRRWINVYGIGGKIGGHWKVIPSKLEKLIERLKKERLPPFDR